MDSPWDLAVMLWNFSLRWFLKYECIENTCAQTHPGSAVSLGKTLKQPRRMDTLRNIHEIIMQIKTTSQEQMKSHTCTVQSWGMSHCNRFHPIRHPGRTKQQRPNTLVVGGHWVCTYEEHGVTVREAVLQSATMMGTEQINTRSTGQGTFWQTLGT